MAPDFSQGLSLQMSQRLEMVMTPQMIQSMEMLQLPLLALEQRIQQELLENPALELEELDDETTGDDVPDEPSAPESAEAGVDAETDPDFPDELAAPEAEDLSRIDDVDFEWDDYYDDSAPRRGDGDDEERFDILEHTAANDVTLASHLEDQLAFLDLSGRQQRFCEAIIHHLEPSGYLTAALDEVAALNGLDASREEMEEAASTVRSLDPAGIGARNLQDCLLLQLERLGPGHEFTRMLVERHLEDVAANRLPKIARALSCEIDDVKLGIAQLKTLNPQPGLQFARTETTAVRADVIAELLEDGSWDIRLAGGARPEISETFLALFDTTKHGRALREKLEKDSGRGEEFRRLRDLLRRGEEGRQLREKYQSARWLLTAIAQRERTLYRVAQEIVAAQSAYLSGQEDAPAPLMMQEVADRIGIDISTVSRAVSDKYLQSPLGLVSLRSLFTRAVGGAFDSSGKESSNVSIMNRIREMIEAEDKRKPLKDDQIQAMLKAEGIDIKRRTVAKYRDNLGYLSHSKRREY